MMVIFHRNFRKNLDKLTTNQKKRVARLLQIFEDNPFNPQLRNHALHGKQKGRRAISAGGDLRIVFIERDNYQHVEFLSVGTHSEVYEP